MSYAVSLSRFLTTGYPSMGLSLSPCLPTEPQKMTFYRLRLFNSILVKTFALSLFKTNNPVIR